MPRGPGGGGAWARSRAAWLGGLQAASAVSAQRLTHENPYRILRSLKHFLLHRLTTWCPVVTSDTLGSSRFERKRCQVPLRLLVSRSFCQE